MKKITLWALTSFFLLSSAHVFAKSNSATVNVGDTLFYTDFVSKPVTFPVTSSLYLASTANANKDTIIGKIDFGAGPNGQRIYFNNTQSVNQYGSTATNYVSQTSSDDGATVGSMQFIKAGTSGGKGYFTLPYVKGPCTIYAWACDGQGYAQRYSVWFQEKSVGNFVYQDTVNLPAGKLIKKNINTYTGTDSLQVKFISGSCASSSSNTNIYFFNILVTAGVNTTTGIETVAASKTPVSTKYYDLFGRETPSTTQGVLIERIIYSDGSSSTKKIIHSGNL